MNRKHADNVLFRISFRLFFVTALLAVFVVPPAVFLPQAYGAEILVGTLADELDGDPGNGECSLREAVANANNDDGAQSDCVAGDGADVIVLPAGEYTLAGASTEDENLGGDLDIAGELAISGQGASATFIQAGTSSPVGGGCVDCADRVLHVHVGATVVASDVSIRHGKAPDGGFDAADTFGGAIFNAGDLTLENCAVTCNRAGDGLEGGDGGGLYSSSSATLNLNHVTVITYRKNLCMKSNGAPSYNTFSGFYRDLEDDSRAFDYKTRTGDRIMSVELLEYTGSTSVVNLDYHSLSGKYHNDPIGWEAFARTASPAAWPVPIEKDTRTTSI